MLLSCQCPLLPSFTALRLISGALMLLLIVRLSQQPLGLRGADWRSALALFVYAVCFSFAYIGLATGTGALILFGCVQLTMIITGLKRGEQLTGMAWAGICLAFAGMVYLLLPGVTAPPPGGALLMATAGIAWGIYSLRGKTSTNPVTVTAANFTLSVPPAILLGLLWLPNLAVSPGGIALAVASGALASGVGYVIWYAALPGLRPSSAATVQLSVPVIAALGGFVLLGEPLTARLIIASTVTLGGIAMVMRN